MNSGNGKNGNGMNGSGNGHQDPDHDPDHNDDDNIVKLPTLAERDRMRKQARKEAKRMLAKQEPMFNMPPTTKYMLMSFIGIHVLLFFMPALSEWTVLNLGFIPGRLTGEADFTIYTIITPITYAFFHGSWVHLIMNTIMLAAFGSGIEKWMGARRMIIFFFACSLIGVALHFIIYPTSLNPVIGASGGLSGFFAAALVMMNQGLTGAALRKRIMPFALLWIGISVAFGLMGGAGGSSIAWIAHIGGFLGGFAVLKYYKYI